MNTKIKQTPPRMMSGAPQPTPEPERIVQALLAESAPARPVEPTPDPFPEIAPEAEVEVTAPEPGPLQRLFDYRPTPRHVALAILAPVLIAMPGFVVALALLALALAVITYLTLGHDRVIELSSARFARLQARDPDAAEALSARLVASRDRLIRILPESLADQVAPTGGDAPLHPKLAEDPFDRLARDAADPRA